jgi:hypothetical protein
MRWIGASVFTLSMDVAVTDREPEDGENIPPRRGPLVALVVVVLLVLGGLWLAHTLTSASRLQDCVMSGRTNCAPIR